MKVSTFGLISESPLVLEWIGDNPPLPVGKTTGFDPYVWDTTTIPCGGQSIVGLIDPNGQHVDADLPWGPPPSNLLEPRMVKLTKRLADVRAAANGDPQKLLPGMTGYQQFNIFAAADQAAKHLAAATGDKLQEISDKLDRVLAKLGA